MKLKIEGATPEAFAKRAFHLLWQACGRPMGMGVFQDRGSVMSEEEVWKQVIEARDYRFGSDEPPINQPPSGEPYGDYVFGRMMKFGLRYDEHGVELVDREFAPDYQSWCPTYPDNDAIVKAVCESLPCGANVV